MNIIKINKYAFKFEDIDLIYPVYIKCKDGEGYYNFRKSLTTSNIIFSRPYQLNHRSTQAQYFDLLLELDYFKLLGINYNFITEMVLINTRLDIDPNRSYYLLDYFIPDLSLCIELDSSYHDQNPIKDKLKDQFLASIGIDVVRIRDFNIGTKEKLESLVEYIKRKKEVKFELSYEELIEDYKEYVNKLEKENSSFICPKWKSAIDALNLIDCNILKHINDNIPYTLVINLNDLYKLIPINRKSVDKYTPLIRYLSTIGITLIITSNKHNRFTRNKTFSNPPNP